MAVAVIAKVQPGGNMSIKCWQSAQVVMMFQVTFASRAFSRHYRSDMGQILADLSQIRITNQVHATRINCMEWRQCLEHLSQWHRCSLQGAYAQRGRTNAPPAPANQWMRIDTGVPMTNQDQTIADQGRDAEYDELIELDQLVTVAAEKEAWAAQQAYQITQVEQTQRDHAAHLNAQFHALAQFTNCYDWDKHGDRLRQFLLTVRPQIDTRWQIFKPPGA